jgi:hypothetical protein
MGLLLQKWDAGGTSFFDVYVAASQTFIATSSYTLDKVELFLANEAVQADTTTTVKIYEVDGSHHPTGGALATMGNVSNTELTTSLSWVSFTGDTVGITSGVEYAIVVEISGTVVCSGDYDSSELSRVKWGRQGGYTNGYGSMVQCYYGPPAAPEGEWESGVVYETQTDDFKFRVYGAPLAVWALFTGVDSRVNGVHYLPLTGVSEGDYIYRVNSGSYGYIAYYSYGAMWASIDPEEIWEEPPLLFNTTSGGDWETIFYNEITGGSGTVVISITEPEAPEGTIDATGTISITSNLSGIASALTKPPKATNPFPANMAGNCKNILNLTWELT